jgi:hypothetical protein
MERAPAIRPKRGFFGNLIKKTTLRRRVGRQIVAEERKKYVALKQVRAETNIWARPLFEDRRPNEKETAAKARYDIVNVEYEARKARIEDLEKRRARVGRGGYWSAGTNKTGR